MNTNEVKTGDTDKTMNRWMIEGLRSGVETRGSWEVSWKTAAGWRLYCLSRSWKWYLRIDGQWRNRNHKKVFHRVFWRYRNHKKVFHRVFWRWTKVLWVWNDM